VSPDTTMITFKFPGGTAVLFRKGEDLSGFWDTSSDGVVVMPATYLHARRDNLHKLFDQAKFHLNRGGVSVETYAKS
jgi:hypothetical protein